MRKGGMLNLGLQNDKAVKTGVNDRMTNEGWNDFNGLTLTSLNRRAEPGGNSSKPFFGPSSSNKQTLRPRPGPHGLNSSRPIFSRLKA